MKEKITSIQLFSLVAHLSFGPTILEISALVAVIAKQDAWIAALITIVFGVLAIWIMLFLSSQHPGMTYIGMMRSILGKWLGLIPAVAFTVFCLEIGSNLLWTSRYFVVTSAMPETPLYAISLLFTVAIVIAYYMESKHLLALPSCLCTLLLGCWV